MKIFCALVIFIGITSTANAKKKCFPVVANPSPDPTPAPAQVCPAHASYSACGAHKSCQATCANPTGPFACAKICLQGCVCEKGYVLDDKNNCIKPEQCPKTNECTKFETFVECSTLCGEATCESRTPRYCGRGCQPRCHCKEGYIRDVAGGKCIKTEQCPAANPCAANEVYSDCGANGCQNTCANPTLSQVCRAICTAGCVCKEGYIRDDKGKCVLTSACPKTNQCQIANEEYKTCGSKCMEDTCDFINGLYARKCAQVCDPGCYCAAGYARENGECILAAACPKPNVCAKSHEEYSDCGTACPLTCANKDNPPLFCTANCFVGCSCEAGYYRDASGECVLPNACPAASS